MHIVLLAQPACSILQIGFTSLASVSHVFNTLSLDWIADLLDESSSVIPRHSLIETVYISFFIFDPVETLI